MLHIVSHQENANYTVMRYNCIRMRIAKVQNINTPLLARVRGNKNSHSAEAETQKGPTSLEDSLAVSYKTKYILTL